MVLDDTDFQIIKYLQQEGRITMRALARRIAMSPPAATERVHRLEEAGIIEGYHATINEPKLGFQIFGYMVAQPLPDKREAFYHYVLGKEEIISCETILSGGQEAIMKICCRSAAHLMQLHEEFFGMATTTTYLVADQPIKQEPINPRLGRVPEGEQERYELIRSIKEKQRRT